MHQVRQYNIDYHRIEPEMHNQNPGEGVIHGLQRKCYGVQGRKNVPKRIGNDGMVWSFKITSMTYTLADKLNDIPIS